MLFHSLHGTEGDYVNQLRMDIGGLDPDRFRAAWQATLDAHEILRSGFLLEGRLASAVAGGIRAGDAGAAAGPARQ
ncbi:hypothetical protein P4200_00375 [Pseudomonas aeruginosa]|nr:hypothetical protein [Pseudomonas aeruginosa]